MGISRRTAMAGSLAGATALGAAAIMHGRGDDQRLFLNGTLQFSSRDE